MKRVPNKLSKADRPDRGANRAKAQPVAPTGWLSGDPYNVGRNAAKRANGTRLRVADRRP